MKKLLLTVIAVVALTTASRIMVVCAQEMAAAPEALTDTAVTNEAMNGMNALGNEMNAIGNLLLHLSGNVGQWVISAIENAPSTRDRPSEFAERGPVPKEELLRTFDETVAQASRVLDSFDTSHFLDATDEQNYVPTMFDLIFNIAIHLATHAGQIVFITKMLKEGSVDELWIRAHKGN